MELDVIDLVSKHFFVGWGRTGGERGRGRWREWEGKEGERERDYIPIYSFIGKHFFLQSNLSQSQNI